VFLTIITTILIAIVSALALLNLGLLGLLLIIALGFSMLIFKISNKHNLLLPFLWLIIPVITLPLQMVDSGSNKLNQLFLGLLMFFGAILLTHKKELLTQFLSNNKVLIILIIYTLLSIAWSNYKTVSLRRFILFLGSVEMALIVSIQQNRFKAFVDLIFYFFLSFSILSIGAVVFFPHYGISHESEYAGAWKGITSHKNSLGAASGIAIIFLIWTYRYFREKKMAFWVNVLLFLNIILLINSKSATSLVSTLVIALFSFILFLLRNQKKLILFYSFCGLFSSYFALRLLEVFFLKRSLVETFFGALNKSTNLTGRTDIWPFMVHSIRGHLWLGGGYESFWIGPESFHDPSTPAYNLCQHFGQYLFEAHNGYIDVLNELGLVGLFILIVFIINLIVRIFRFLGKSHDQFFLFISLVIFVIISNFLETSFMRSNSFNWLLILFIFFLSDNNLQVKQEYS